MSLTILTVDDSRTMRDMLRMALNAAGMQVHQAEDGVHGLEVLSTCSPDCIINDLNMPRMDGFGFIEEVRKIPQYQLLPILILTTESDAERKAKARSIGATGWITKPFEPEKLISVVKRVAS